MALWSVYLGILVAICCGFALSPAVQATAQHKQVLMITSYHHGDAWKDGTLANNGQEALYFLKLHDFDCILMDIQMPVMTGDEATRRIRAAEVHGSRFSCATVEETAVDGVDGGAHRGAPDGVAPNTTSSRATTDPTVNREPLNHEPSKTVNREPGTVNQRKRIPIIAVTAHTQPGDRERFLAAGMDDYLAKPVSVDDLERVLNRTVRHSVKITQPSYHNTHGGRNGPYTNS